MKTTHYWSVFTFYDRCGPWSVTLQCSSPLPWWFFSTMSLGYPLRSWRCPANSRYGGNDNKNVNLDIKFHIAVGESWPLFLFNWILQPTRDDRGWLINPIGRNPWWTVLAASIPALLCTILIFMDQQITAVIINRKEHKLLVRKNWKIQNKHLLIEPAFLCCWF